MSQERIILIVFAKDRPGIVDLVSDTILANHGNWLESSLSRLCGQFAGIVHAEVSTNEKGNLLDALNELAEDGIQITVQDAEQIEEDNAEINGLQIMVEANDRPGIIKEISEALAQENINVENIDTEVASASMAGYPLFRAHLFLAMPDDVSESDLESILESVSDDLMVSILEA